MNELELTMPDLYHYLCNNIKLFIVDCMEFDKTR